MMGLYAPARDYVLHLKFKPKPRFAAGFFVGEPDADPASIRAGQLFIQPEVELADGTRTLLDYVLGPDFSCLQWHGAAEAAALPASLPTELPMRTVTLVRCQDDFPPPGSGHAGTMIVRDCEGLIERVMHASRATAVVLRPDRYVLAWFQPEKTAAKIAQLQSLVQSTWNGEASPVPAHQSPP